MIVIRKVAEALGKPPRPLFVYYGKLLCGAPVIVQRVVGNFVILVLDIGNTG